MVNQRSRAEIDVEVQGARQAEQELRGAADAVDDLGDASGRSASGIDDLEFSLDGATRALGGLATAAAAYLSFDFFRDVATERVEIEQLGRAFGFSADEAHRLHDELVGTSAEFDDAIDLAKELAIRANDAVRGNEDLRDIFIELGTAPEQFLALSSDQRLDLFERRILDIEDATRQLIIADELGSDAAVRYLGALTGSNTELSATEEGITRYRSGGRVRQGRVRRGDRQLPSRWPLPVKSRAAKRAKTSGGAHGRISSNKAGPQVLFNCCGWEARLPDRSATWLTPQAVWA